MAIQLKECRQSGETNEVMDLLFMLSRSLLSRMVLVIFFLMSFSPFTEAKVSVFKLPENQSTTSYPFNAEEGFAELQGRGKIWGLKLVPHGELALSSVQVKGGTIIPGDGNKRIILVGAREAVIQNEKGVGLYRVQWVPEASGLKVDGCDSKIFSLSLSQLPMGFPLSLSCQFETPVPTFLVSVPEDVQWEEFTFDERAGKGERWRQFNIPALGLEDRMAGYFVFSYNGESQKVSVNISKLKKGDFDEKGKKVVPIKKAVGVLFNQTELKLESESYHSSNLSMTLAAQTEELVPNWRMGFSTELPLGITQDNNLIARQRTNLHIGYEGNVKLSERSQWNWAVLGYYQALNYSHVPSSFTMQATTLGFGLENQWVMGAGRSLLLKMDMYNLGSKLFQKFSELVLLYRQNLQLYNYDWVLLVGLQNVQVDSVSKSKSRTLGTNSIVIGFEF